MKLLRPLLQGSAFGLVFVDVVVDDDGLFYEHGLVRNSPEWNSAIGLELSSAVERSLIVDCRRFSATSTLFSVIRIVRACDTLGISRHLKRDRALFVSRSISRANSISLVQCHRDNCQLLRRGNKAVLSRSRFRIFRFKLFWFSGTPGNLPQLNPQKYTDSHTLTPTPRRISRKR